MVQVAVELWKVQLKAGQGFVLEHPQCVGLGMTPAAGILEDGHEDDH